MRVIIFIYLYICVFANRQRLVLKIKKVLKCFFKVRIPFFFFLITLIQLINQQILIITHANIET